eukprot:980718-Pyramimonas_sp.AAC.1
MVRNSRAIVPRVFFSHLCTFLLKRHMPDLLEVRLTPGRHGSLAGASWPHPAQERVDPPSGACRPSISG